jgi:hypothetical protein
MAKNMYVRRDGFTVIVTKRGHEVLVNTDDVPKLEQYNWITVGSGRTRYAIANLRTGWTIGGSEIHQE